MSKDGRNEHRAELAIFIELHKDEARMHCYINVEMQMVIILSDDWIRRFRFIFSSLAPHARLSHPGHKAAGAFFVLHCTFPQNRLADASGLGDTWTLLSSTGDTALSMISNLQAHLSSQSQQGQFQRSRLTFMKAGSANKFGEPHFQECDLISATLRNNPRIHQHKPTSPSCSSKD